MGFTQTLAYRNNQENEASNNAKNVDDKSLRGEKLKGASNVAQRNDKNELGICGGEFLLRRRSPGLLNSKVNEFKNQTYTCSYRLPKEDSTFKAWDKEIVPFNVKYKPLDHKVNIEMPVMFMGPTNLHKGRNPIDWNSRRGTMSAEIPDHFKRSYKNSIKRVWSNKHQLCLDAKAPVTNGLCYDWARINPVDVDVSIKESTNAAKSYKVYYVNSTKYRDNTGPDRVIFSRQTYIDRKADMKGVDKQNVFAHEFGHQIGLGDEYPVDHVAKSGTDTFDHVYWLDELENRAILRAYDRSAHTLRVHDLENLATTGGQLDHNDEHYVVKSGTDNDGYDFYYLEYLDGTRRNRSLDGRITSHTKMVEREYDEQYALENATMYDWVENYNWEEDSTDDTANKPALEDSIMNGGSSVEPRHYIPFKYGMVEAIRTKYNDPIPSEKAPNMNEDWKIE